MSDKTKNPRILVSGGGTGGHIFPALSIANAIKRRLPDADILFVGAKGRMEMERVPAAGYPIKGLEIAGFDRKKLWRNFAVIIKLLRSMLKARKILREFRPDIAIGVGGYASGPMLKAAQKAGIPTMLQEQNSYAGVTNKLLGKKARKICVAYDGMDRFFPGENIVLTGNPVRHNIVTASFSREDACKRLGLDPTRPVVLIVGGSLGSRTINEATAKMADEIAQTGAQIYWQTGKAYIEQYRHMNNPAKGIYVNEFIPDMDVAYKAATLTVSRAGAGTISELQIVGMPTILVPSPNVAEDHQRKNAMALVDRDAAVFIADNEAVEKLGKEVKALLSSSERLEALKKNILEMALPNADDDIAEIAINIINNK